MDDTFGDLPTDPTLVAASGAGTAIAARSVELWATATTTVVSTVGPHTAPLWAELCGLVAGSWDGLRAAVGPHAEAVHAEARALAGAAAVRELSRMADSVRWHVAVAGASVCHADLSRVPRLAAALLFVLAAVTWAAVICWWSRRRRAAARVLNTEESDRAAREAAEQQEAVAALEQRCSKNATSISKATARLRLAVETGGVLRAAVAEIGSYHEEVEGVCRVALPRAAAALQRYHADSAGAEAEAESLAAAQEQADVEHRRLRAMCNDATTPALTGTPGQSESSGSVSYSASGELIVPDHATGPRPGQRGVAALERRLLELRQLERMLQAEVSLLDDCPAIMDRAEPEGDTSPRDADSRGGANEASSAAGREDAVKELGGQEMLGVSEDEEEEAEEKRSE